MREASFLVSPNAPVALSTTWTAIKLTAVSASAANSRVTPACAYLGDVEIDLDTVVTAVSVQAMLTYDLAGLKSLAGPTAATTFANLSGSLGSVSFAVDKIKTWPASGATMPTTGECYLWLKVNAGTANLTAAGARLQWHDPAP